VLFPVDCNYAFKHVGQEMKKVAESTKSLAPEQYESRKRHKAIDLAVNKALTFDILRQLKRSGAVCSNDAKSCYDLIGHTQAALSMQRVGVPKNIINCLFTTLQDAIHKVRTGFGDSKAHYGGSVWLVPIHGIGQGNGAGSTIWAVVSTPLLNLLRKKGYGCEIICLLSSTFFRFVGYAFVDDTDVIQSLLADNPDSARLKLQEAIDTWEYSLKTTCGALVPKKTVWWLVSFKWTGAEWAYAGIQDSPGELQVNDTSNSRKTIMRLEPDQAYETLGVFLAPDGNLDAQFEKMLSAVKVWVVGLRTGKLSKEESWLALQSTILHTLAYPLPVLRLSKAQCEAIMEPLFRYCLPSLGICRNFPRKLVFSTLDYMGLNFIHLFTLHDIVRLKDIVFHTMNNTLTGKLYTSSLELLLLELGCSTSYSWDPVAIDLLATDSLIKAIWCFLFSNRITLVHTIKLEFSRENDCFIMEALCAIGTPLDDLKRCNHCRMYLRALFLSDIVTGDGLSITDPAWNGEPYVTPHKELSWPMYGKPPKSYWDIWRYWLRHAFLGRGRRLRAPLGQWFHFDEKWPWYIDSDGSLLGYHNGVWYHHNPVIRRNRLPTFDAERTICQKPRDFSRATVHCNRSRIICSGVASIIQTSIENPSTFLQTLQQDSELHWCISILKTSRLLKRLFWMEQLLLFLMDCTKTLLVLLPGLLGT
jgi:hypothetical protein